MTRQPSDRWHVACELIRKVWIACALLAVLAAASAVVVSAQAEQSPAAHSAQPADAAHQAPDDHVTEGEHAAGEHTTTIWGRIGPTFNFLILCGLLYYVLRTPISGYLQSRRTGIRKDLVEAAELRRTATEQLAEIDRKVEALPGEIDALRRRGAEEIAAEEQRIATQAANERERLLEQTRREIDVQLRIAKRELVEHAADLAVQLATDRIERDITPADQDRIVDRYLGQVRPDESGRQG